VSSQLHPARVLLTVGPWALGTFIAATALPVYLSASTRLDMEGISESPARWTVLVLLGLVAAVAVVGRTWSLAAWRPLRTVLLSGAVAGMLGTSAYGTYVYWFSSATLASGAGAPAIGARAPAFEITDPDGRVRSLDAYAGKTLLLVFYRGHW